MALPAQPRVPAWDPVMVALNPLLVDTGTPPIPEAQSWARDYDGSHGELINLSQAVPGYPPHPRMLEELARAAGEAATASYGPIFGDDALRDAYAAHLSQLSGGTVGAQQVAITMGCNQAFIVAMQALAKAGDSVVLPEPWYFNHQMSLQMMGIGVKPLACRAEAGFVPDPDDAAALIDDSVRALVLVTPNNPTGAVYPPDTIARFHALCRSRGIALVLDETYRDFLPTGAGAGHDLYSDPAWGDTLVSLYSFSKSYCIPGHRLGVLAGGAALLEQVGKVLDCYQICPPRTGQVALVPMIPALAAWREANRHEIAQRAAVFRAAMAQANGWRVDSVGSYFAFVAHPFPGTPAASVAERLARERGVLALPGPYFGAGQESHLRIAFANAERSALAGLPARLRGFAP